MEIIMKTSAHLAYVLILVFIALLILSIGFILPNKNSMKLTPTGMPIKITYPISR